AVGDGTGAGDVGLVDLLGIHQLQERGGGVVPQLAEGERPQVSIHIDDHERRLRNSCRILAAKILSLSGPLKSTARRRPMLAVMDISHPKTTRSTPSTRAASSTTPSSVTLPLVSRKTLEA